MVYAGRPKNSAHSPSPWPALVGSTTLQPPCAGAFSTMRTPASDAGATFGAVGRGAAVASLADQLVQPENLVRAVHREDRQVGPQVAPGDVVAAEVRRHEDDRPVGGPQALDRFPAIALEHRGGDLVEGPEERPGELGRALADLVRRSQRASRITSSRDRTAARGEVLERRAAVAAGNAKTTRPMSAPRAWLPEGEEGQDAEKEFHARPAPRGTLLKCGLAKAR
jgi:hypothetical protein